MSIFSKSYAAFPIKELKVVHQNTAYVMPPVQTVEKQEHRKSSLFGFTSLGLSMVALPTYFFLANNVGDLTAFITLIAIWGIGVIAGAIGLDKKGKHKWAAWLGLILCSLGILFILFLLFLFFVVYGGDPS